jgi:hypothetical protein
VVAGAVKTADGIAKRTGPARGPRPQLQPMGLLEGLANGQEHLAHWLLFQFFPARCIMHLCWWRSTDAPCSNPPPRVRTATCRSDKVGRLRWRTLSFECRSLSGQSGQPTCSSVSSRRTLSEEIWLRDCQFAIPLPGDHMFCCASYPLPFVLHSLKHIYRREGSYHSGHDAHRG